MPRACAIPGYGDYSASRLCRMHTGHDSKARRLGDRDCIVLAFARCSYAHFESFMIGGRRATISTLDGDALSPTASRVSVTSHGRYLALSRHELSAQLALDY